MTDAQTTAAGLEPQTPNQIASRATFEDGIEMAAKVCDENADDIDNAPHTTWAEHRAQITTRDYTRELASAIRALSLPMTVESEIGEGTVSGVGLMASKQGVGK